MDNERDVRLECLRLAISTGAPAPCLDRAKEFYAWVKWGKSQPVITGDDTGPLVVAEPLAEEA